MDTLSRRERQCVALLAEGRTNEQIANALCLARNTVHQHLASAYQRLDLGDIGDPRVRAAVLWEREQGKEEG